jgi:hypothetical protein
MGRRFRSDGQGVSAIEEMSATAAPSAAPLTDMMLVMDVADTIRHDPGLAADVVALRGIYARLGIGITDEIVVEGIAAYHGDRFAYVPPKAGLGTALAGLYVHRRSWLPAATAIGLILVIGLGGYFLVYRPLRHSQVQQARLELAQTLPNEMDSLYETIHEETKVQQAETEAVAIRDRGKTAAQKGDRAGAEAAVADLIGIRDTIRQDYQLDVVDRPGVKWGFWTFPEDNTEATNYYLVVEAIGQDNAPLTLPIHDEQTGKTDNVAMWGLRVPEEVYRAVEADKTDDGKIQRPVMGVKQFGFLEPDYVVQVLGGTVTRW